MGFFGMVLKPGQTEAVEVPPGWCLQLCSAALEPPNPKSHVKAKDLTATLWVQVEGELGDSAYLLGTLQGGGSCAQITLTHALDSADGEVILEANGTGVIHLTGYFNRDHGDDDMHHGDSSDSDDFERYSAESAEESSEDDSEGQSEDKDDNRISSAGIIEGEVVTKGAKAAGWGKEAAPNSNGRAVRSAALAAMRACGTGSGEGDNSEEDSEIDGEYIPRGTILDDEEDESEDEDSGEDGVEDGDTNEEDKEDEEEEVPEVKSAKNKKGQGKKEQEVAGSKRTAAASKSETSKSAPPAKKSRTDKKQAGDEGAEASAAKDSALTKAERKRQRKKENKRKAAEAKRALEEAFSGMDNPDKGEPPIGVPLKSPRTKTLKGGLKIKDTTLGGGKMAVPGKNVKIVYEGCFPDGRVFDKNQNRRRPLQFRVGMQSVITGMDRGVEGMRVGGSREIAIPAALGYGSRGTGPIPPNQDLVFRVELLEVLGK